MTAISLKLPEDLAQESKVVASKMGISRTELIRQALRHELDKLEANLERAAMAEALKTMRNDPSYIEESDALIEGLPGTLPKQPDNWWQG